MVSTVAGDRAGKEAADERDNLCHVGDACRLDARYTLAGMTLWGITLRRHGCCRGYDSPGMGFRLRYHAESTV